MKQLATLTGLERLRSVADDAAGEKPAYAAESIYGVLPTDNAQLYDPRELLARVLDGSRFSEFKRLYGPTLTCGFGKIGGERVGVLANGGVLDTKASQKGAHFVELCSQRGVPVLFLQNITGFSVGSLKWMRM